MPDTRFGRCLWRNIARAGGDPKAERDRQKRKTVTFNEAMASPTDRFPMCYGTHFTDPGAGGSAVPEIKAALEAGELFRAHAFELACARAGIEHRLTKPNHP